MGIDVYVKNERGGILGRASDADMLSRFAEGSDARESRVLCYLDPYGDLILNRAQATTLLEDLAIIIPRQEGRFRSFLEELRVLAEQVAGGTHLYLWFIGD